MTFIDHVVDQSSIRFKRSTTPGETPDAGSLRVGEIAINTADAVVFIGQEDGAVSPVGGGGASYDQSLNTTDSVTFNSITLPNNTQITVGTFDNLTGGAGGISLHCAVGYELNWQGGRLRSVMTGDSTHAPQTIYVDSPMQFNGGVMARVVSLAAGPTLNTDASTGDIFDVTLTGNATLANPTNPVDGQTVRWRIRQDATGGRTVTLGNKFVIPSSATSPLPFSTAANKMDVLAATYHAGRDKWDIIAFVMGY
jgi:hypothetical protein